jgi:hypothetical protein
VASLLLVIGVLATAALLDRGAQATSTSLRRDTANAIAREMVERVHGMQYTILANDLTDVRTAAPRTPADRLRAAMDPTAPTGARQSTDPVIQGTRTPIADAPAPWATTAEWTLRRRNVPFTLTYQACTRSEAQNVVRVLGPADCDRPTTTTPTGPGSTLNGCMLALTLPASTIKDLIRHDPGNVVVDVQLLNLVGVGACVQGTLNALQLGNLLTPLCKVLGDGTNALSSVTGLLNSILGPLASNVALSVCPTTNSTTSNPEPPAGIATSTEVHVTVSWRNPGASVDSKIVQSTVVRRSGT